MSAQVLLFNVQSEIARFHMTSVRYWLVPQNSETATSPVGVEPFSYVKTLFFFLGKIASVTAPIVFQRLMYLLIKGFSSASNHGLVQGHPARI